MMIVTNMLRLKTRHTWAAIAKRYLLPVEQSQLAKDEPLSTSSTPRILFLPVLRGMWCPPIIQAFRENIINSKGTSHTLQCLAMDSFGSQYCTDTSDWFEVNMKLEKVDEYVTTLWTDYKTFPLADASVDVVCMPTGLFLPYISDNNVPEEEITKRKKAVMSEIFRVLKPGGVLLASNIGMFVGAWESLIREQGLIGIETLPDNLWWTYLPAKMTVGFKSHDHSEQVSSATHLSTDVDHTFVITKDNPSPHIIQAKSDNMWFPPGRHWRLVEVLCISTLVAWIALILMVWGFMDELQAPSTVPYGVQFAALFVSNLISLPIVFFTMFADLRNVARGFEINRNNSGKTLNKSENSLPDNGSPGNLEKDQQVASLRTRRILRVYKKQLTYLAYLIGILTWVSWLPYFGLDLVLYKTTSFSLSKIQFINNMVAIGVFFTLIPIFRFISDRLKQQDRKLALQDAIDDKLLSECQATFSNGEGLASSGVSPLHVDSIP